jgi:hypothetical protein
MAAMPKDLFCIPTAKTAVPAGPDWIHEVKYDGYRLRVERNGDRVRLLSRGGLDWTKPDRHRFRGPSEGMSSCGDSATAAFEDICHRAFRV